MWDRRKFLQSVAAGTGAAWLSAHFPGIARAQADGRPARFVFVIEGNGIESYAFLSNQARAFIDSPDGQRVLFSYYTQSRPEVMEGDALDTAPALGALAGGAGQVSLLEDATVLLGLHSTITGGSHSANCGALSCTRSSPARPAGQTIDAFLANELGRSTPFDAIRLGITGGGAQITYTPSAYDAGRAAPVVNEPVAAYEDIFGAVLEGTAGDRFRNRRALLEFAGADVTAALGDFPGGGKERGKLTDYADAISALQDRQRLLSGQDTSVLDYAELMRRFLPPRPVETEDPLAALENQFQTATGALLSQLTNVVVLASGTGSGSGYNISYRPSERLPSLAALLGNSDPSMDRHDLQHGSVLDEGVSEPNYARVILEATTYHVELACRMARALKAQPEGDGTMLDNTVIVYMSDNGEQHHSKATDWPILLLGGRNLGLAGGGRSVLYPRRGTEDEMGVRTDRQVSNFFNTLAHLGGRPDITLFGGEGDVGGGRVAAGPLPELLA